MEIPFARPDVTIQALRYSSNANAYPTDKPFSYHLFKHNRARSTPFSALSQLEALSKKPNEDDWLPSVRPCTRMTICCAGIVCCYPNPGKLWIIASRFQPDCDIIGTGKVHFRPNSPFLHNLSSLLYTQGEDGEPNRAWRYRPDLPRTWNLRARCARYQPIVQFLPQLS